MTRTLQEILLSPDRRKAVVDDCQKLIDDEVTAKEGASGLVVKASYKIVKAVSPDMIRHSCDNLLPDFVARLEPFYAAYQADSGGASLQEYFAARADEISDALLAVTDERAASARSTLKAAYDKLRPQAKKHIGEALPNLSKLIDKHAAS
ncbi:MAG: DUF6918 family protein [Micromonosporaceae bacterium]